MPSFDLGCERSLDGILDVVTIDLAVNLLTLMKNIMQIPGRVLFKDLIDFDEVESSLQTAGKSCKSIGLLPAISLLHGLESSTQRIDGIAN